jgi:hypothetical protein
MSYATLGMTREMEQMGTDKIIINNININH